MHARLTFFLGCICFFALIQSVAAQEPLDLEESKPAVTAQGVTVVTQSIVLPTQSMNYEDVTPKAEAEKARGMFVEANAKFEDRQLVEALELYQQAYALWPHPRIVFNMGVTLSMMSRPLEAANMFKIVLEYGPQPVEEHRYKEAQEKYLELMGTLSVLTVKCTQEDTKVYIDGALLAVCPFQKSVTLTSGRHLFTANQDGFIPVSEDIFLPPGVVAEKSVELRRFEQVVRFKQVERYSMRWPVATTVAAAVLMGAGGYMLYSGRAQIDDLNDEINDIVSREGSRPFDFDLSRQDKPVMMQNVGSGLLSVGVTSLVTAAVLFVMQKKTVTETVTPGADSRKSNAKVK